MESVVLSSLLYYTYAKAIQCQSNWLNWTDLDVKVQNGYWFMLDCSDVNVFILEFASNWLETWRRLEIQHQAVHTMNVLQVMH